MRFHSIFEGVQEFMMPLLWFDQIADIDEKNAKIVKLAINLKHYGSIFAYSLLGLGVGIVTLGFILTVTNKWKCSHRDDEDPILNEPVQNSHSPARDS